MPQNPPTQADPILLTKLLRDAMKRNGLENVFRAAGATRITGQATEILAETTAAHVAPLLAQGRLEIPLGTPAPHPPLTDAAHEAFEAAKLEDGFQAAGIDPEKGQRAVAREMVRIAQSATAFAKSEGRPVCHNCSAVGASLAASKLATLPDA